jgi:hypothetical protein
VRPFRSLGARSSSGSLAMLAAIYILKDRFAAEIRDALAKIAAIHHD